jgi:hypothetical protein
MVTPWSCVVSGPSQSFDISRHHIGGMAIGLRARAERGLLTMASALPVMPEPPGRLTAPPATPRASDRSSADVRA